MLVTDSLLSELERCTASFRVLEITIELYLKRKTVPDADLVIALQDANACSRQLLSVIAFNQRFSKQESKANVLRADGQVNQLDENVNREGEQRPNSGS